MDRALETFGTTANMLTYNRSPQRRENVPQSIFQEIEIFNKKKLAYTVPKKLNKLKIK